ncbi:hypothetical protein BZB76_1899 [Actinomadura pelletieri DSM 43383]|uniref:Guanylate cyclase domain-containing protein n=1 Tax=Actinomadura pelletieri DSM 43383 TaxID=1120940 RepID=A0A495QSV9_9ACTN|nr:hypothetical protein [Actinomadura pelletieri]RKS76543.1 hypothetical protein BZB76_1899 [Actinomadura pelletieri DSM 43383]
MDDFRAVLVVDAERFSAHRDVDLPDVHKEIREVLAVACADSGLRGIWDNVKFKESTGDGILAVLPHEAVPALIDPFPRRLQSALAESAPRLRARGLRLRLRVALHVGLVDDERVDAPGISTAVIDTCRLLDSAPLRRALDRSDPEVTFAALLISEDLFTAYVRGGRSSLRESQFEKVQVQVKRYDRSAYLYVPVPSRTQRPDEDDPPAEKRAAPPPPPSGTSISGITIPGDGTQNAFGNTVGGDLRQDRR